MVHFHRNRPRRMKKCERAGRIFAGRSFGGVAWKEPTMVMKLNQVPRHHCSADLPGRVKNLRIGRRYRPPASVIYLAQLPPRKGRKNGDRGTLEPSAFMGASCSLFGPRHFIVQAERRPMVAIGLSRDAIPKHSNQVPSVVSTVALFPEGGQPPTGGDMVERRCDFSQVAFVSAIPGSTS